jgi:hypothetical protein
MHLGHPMIFSHRDKNKLYYFTYNKDNRLGYLDHQFLGTTNSNHLHQGTTFCMLFSTDGQSSQPCSCCFSHPCTKHQSLQLLVRLLATCSLLTVKIRQPSHEFTFGVGMTFVSYSLVLTPVV